MLNHVAEPAERSAHPSTDASAAGQGPDAAVVVPVYMPCDCSTCGRKLRVLVRYLGRAIECPSCHRRFAAHQHNDPLSAVERADRLLACLDARNRDGTRPAARPPASPAPPGGGPPAPGINHE